MNAILPEPGGRSVRSVFISDTHLGTRHCRADFLADFLRSVRCERLYLVGDIIDGWQLRRSWYWDRGHDEVVQQIVRLARNGTRVTYIPGNHDEMLRGWLGLGVEVAGVRLAREATHVTAAGQRLLVMHGDEFDCVVCHARALAYLGDRAYDFALNLNLWFNALRRRLGYPYWSLSAWAKRRVKRAVMAINRFEVALAAEAERRGYDGVVCGHIHYAEMRDVNGMLYCNVGDWVESCTVLAEHHDGRLELIDWAAENGLSFFTRRARSGKAEASAIA